MTLENDEVSSVVKPLDAMTSKLNDQNCARTRRMTGWDPDKQREAFRRVMAQAGYKSAAAIARVSGVPDTTIRSYLNGQAESLSARTEKKICDATGLDLAQIYGNPSVSTAKPVWVLGFIVEGGAVSELESKPLPKGPPTGLREPAAPYTPEHGLYEVAAPAGLDPALDYVAYELRGFAMPPAQDRWIVYFLRDAAAPAASLIGQACIVHLADGRALFRIIRRGYAPDRYNLEGFGGGHFQEDAEIVSAYPYVGCCRPDLVKA